MLVFKGKLAPEDGALFLKAMDAFMQARDTKNVSAETFLPTSENEPIVVEEVDEEVDEVVDKLGDQAPEETDTFVQKRADALVQMAEHAVSTAADGAVPLTGGDKVQVVVHLNAHAPENSLESSAYIENGPALSPQTVRRLADDASLVTVLEDGSGNVLNVGRKSRTISPAIRRALVSRDGGCRFPGCCESKYVDAHHIHHWCDGGETRLDNLVLLCRRHHRLVHEEGYGIVMTDSGTPVLSRAL